MKTSSSKNEMQNDVPVNSKTEEYIIGMIKLTSWFVTGLLLIGML